MNLILTNFERLRGISSNGIERSLSMSEDLGSMSGFSIFFFLWKLLLLFFLLFLANSSDNKKVCRCKLRLTILFKFLASRTSLCLGRAYWGMRSPINVVSGTGTRDEPLRTSVLEAQPKYLNNVHRSNWIFETITAKCPTVAIIKT